MKPDYAKATAELIDRLRRQASTHALTSPPAPLPMGVPTHVVIHAPRDCVFYISPNTPPKPNHAD